MWPYIQLDNDDNYPYDLRGMLGSQDETRPGERPSIMQIEFYNPQTHTVAGRSVLLYDPNLPTSEVDFAVWASAPSGCTPQTHKSRSIENSGFDDSSDDSDLIPV